MRFYISEFYAESEQIYVTEQILVIHPYLGDLGDNIKLLVSRTV